MHFKKLFLVCLALPLLAILLASCEDRAELAEKQITADRIKGDLVNQKVAGVAEGDFLIEKPGYVELLEMKYEEGKPALAKIAIKAIDMSSKTGVEGKLSVVYEYASGHWQMKELGEASLQEMNKHYAKRLTELADFPLHFAANIGDIEQVASELEKGVPVDSPERGKESSALMFASERGRLDIVQLLVAKGAEVNYRNRFGMTPLHAASYGNHLEIVQFLVDKGADINAAAESGQTPLYYAAINDAIEVASYLVGKGTDINARSKNNRSPLFAAAESNSLEVAKFLIESGAEVNIKTAEGNYSPLLSASYYNSVQMVELLLDAGADTSARLSGFHSRRGNFTALELAEKKGNKKIIELLKKKQGQ